MIKTKHIKFPWHILHCFLMSTPLQWPSKPYRISTHPYHPNFINCNLSVFTNLASPQLASLLFTHVRQILPLAFVVPRFSHSCFLDLLGSFLHYSLLSEAFIRLQTHCYLFSLHYLSPRNLSSSNIWSISLICFMYIIFQ